MLFEDVLKQLETQSFTRIDLSLRSQDIGDEEVEALCMGFETNATLKHIDLRGNCIGDAGAKALSKILLTSRTIESIDLGGNNISDAGLKDLSEALENNTTLVSLSLRQNNFSFIGLDHLSKMIIRNSALITIDLGANKISYLHTYPAFTQALQINSTLKHIILSNNSMGYRNGFNQLCEVIKANSTIESIDLSATNFSTEDFRNLCSALKLNPSIKSVNLNFNLFNPDYAMRLSELLKSNTSLEVLTLPSRNSNSQKERLIKYEMRELHKNYTLVTLHGVTSLESTIKNYLERNQEINRHSAKHFELYIRGALDQKELVKSYEKLTDLILELHGNIDYFKREDFHKKHYLAEAHRLLAALMYMCEGQSGEAEAVTNLIPPFVHPQLHKISERLQNQLLGTSLNTIHFHSVKHFNAFISKLGDGLDRDALISSHEEITHIIQKIKNPLSETHYLTEIHRLLTALIHMAALGSEDMDAIAHLLPTFKNQQLQNVADLAISFILSTSMHEKIKPSTENMSSQQQRAHYQLILHGLGDSLEQYKELQPFIYNALSRLLYGKNGANFTVVSELLETTVLLSYQDCLILAKKADQKINADHKKKNSFKLGYEELLLINILKNNDYNEGVLEFLSKSPTFVAVVKEEYPGKKSLALLEHCLFKTTEPLLFQLPDIEVPTTSQHVQQVREACCVSMTRTEKYKLIKDIKKIVGERMGVILDTRGSEEDQAQSLSPQYPIDNQKEIKIGAFGYEEEAFLGSIKQVQKNLLLKKVTSVSRYSMWQEPIQETTPKGPSPDCVGWL